MQRTKYENSAPPRIISLQAIILSVLKMAVTWLRFYSSRAWSIYARSDARHWISHEDLNPACQGHTGSFQVIFEVYWRNWNTLLWVKSGRWVEAEAFQISLVCEQASRVQFQCWFSSINWGIWQAVRTNKAFHRAFDNWIIVCSV